MKRILIPTFGPCRWRGLLADPNKQWKRTCSAFELAMSWEGAQRSSGGCGLPSEVAAVLDAVPTLKNAELVFASPEHQVQLNTARAPSQTDLWALLRAERGFISLGVEGKAGEPFAKTVTDWLKKDNQPEGRIARLKWLCHKLNVGDSEAECGSLRYQLFHRTVSALLEATRCGASSAVMLVQAFPGAETSWDDFGRFCEYLGVGVEPGRLVPVPSQREPQLYVGWVSSLCASDAEIAAIMADD